MGEDAWLDLARAELRQDTQRLVEHGAALR